jgi:hypothetical protein
MPDLRFLTVELAEGSSRQRGGSFLAGAKRHHLEPWAYLRDVLLRLSAGATEWESLLPDRWAASHPEHVLQHRLDESRRKAARQKARREHRRAKARPKA